VQQQVACRRADCRVWGSSCTQHITPCFTHKRQVGSCCLPCTPCTRLIHCTARLCEPQSRLLSKTMGSQASVARFTKTSVPQSANLGTVTSRVRCPSGPALASRGQAISHRDTLYAVHGPQQRPRPPSPDGFGAEPIACCMPSVLINAHCCYTGSRGLLRACSVAQHCVSPVTRRCPKAGWLPANRTCGVAVSAKGSSILNGYDTSVSGDVGTMCRQSSMRAMMSSRSSVSEYLPKCSPEGFPSEAFYDRHDAGGT